MSALLGESFRYRQSLQGFLCRPASSRFMVKVGCILPQGINALHKEFLTADGSRSRVRQGFSADGLPPPDMDCHGHGTHVAGTVAGLTYGVAKNAWLHPCEPPAEPAFTNIACDICSSSPLPPHSATALDLIE